MTAKVKDEKAQANMRHSMMLTGWAGKGVLYFTFFALRI
jgi:hypothetical protein